MDKIKVCAYCRVSTSSNDQENSFENQKEYFQRETNNNKNYELVEIYADRGITGTSLNKREQFNVMLHDAGLDIREITNSEGDRRQYKMKYTYITSSREPKFNLILVKNTSRFARNILVMDIIRELKKKKVYVYFLDVNKTTENDADEMLLQMLFTIDEEESKSKSRKVSFGHNESAIKGAIHTNGRLYGYNYNKINRELEIIPEEAEIISEVFNLYSQGIGARKITQIFTEKQYRTREGKPFNPNLIQRITANEKYCGILARNKWTKGTIFNECSQKLKPQEEWIVHKDKIPPIITEELFHKCIELRKSKKNYQAGVGKFVGIDEFRGMIICANCGYNFISHRNAYGCGNKKRYGIKACNSSNLRKSLLNKYIEKYCKNDFHEVIAYTKISERLKLEELKFMLNEKYNKDNNDKVIEFNTKIQELQLQKDKLIDLYLNSTVSKDVIERKDKDIDNEIKRYNMLIIEYSRTNLDIEKEIEEIDKTIARINEISVKKEYTREEFIKEIDSIIVKPVFIDGKLQRDPEVYFKFKITSLFRKVTEKYNLE